MPGHGRDDQLNTFFHDVWRRECARFLHHCFLEIVLVARTESLHGQSDHLWHWHDLRDHVHNFGGLFRTEGNGTSPGVSTSNRSEIRSCGGRLDCLDTLHLYPLCYPNRENFLAGNSLVHRWGFRGVLGRLSCTLHGRRHPCWQDVLDQRSRSRGHVVEHKCGETQDQGARRS